MKNTLHFNDLFYAINSKPVWFKQIGSQDKRTIYYKLFHAKTYTETTSDDNRVLEYAVTRDVVFEEDFRGPQYNVRIRVLDKHGWTLYHKYIGCINTTELLKLLYDDNEATYRVLAGKKLPNVIRKYFEI